ncbi:MAG: FeoB-associated Cys-rich membrane protein [Clostridia bacterium]|nr:FeoB-associated Cys-rich membrane protein [Clostridia bacterium]
MEIIIILAIAAWAAFVIIRKIRRAKRGQYCDCGCSSCSESCNCKENGLRHSPRVTDDRKTGE